MCPACLTTVALIAAGASSSGGLGALVLKTLRGKAGAESGKSQPKPETDHSDAPAFDGHNIRSIEESGS